MTAYRTKDEVSVNLAAELAPFPPLTQRLLRDRGLLTKEDAQAFLSPDYSRHTHDPFLMKGMEQAVARAYKAIQENEKIIIFSDYDADGGPGGVVLHDLFRKVGYKNFENYIPNRHLEGFGLSNEAVKEFAEAGAKVIITVDCGVADLTEVALAQALGIDVIITDHHEPHGGIPPAFAILDPKQADCGYPDKNLCGSGVAFKLVQGFLKKHAAEFGIVDGWEKWLLDLVGIATLSDMVPLVGENRVFAYYGLKVLRKSPRPGLMKLLRKLRMSQKDLTEDDVAFMITPRLNAASRMGEPMDAFNLLATKDESEADRLSDHLNAVNDERKGTVAAMIKEMKRIMRERAGEVGRKVLVIGNPKWRPALLGPAAHSLTEEHLCPVFVWGRDGNDKLKGSCRSDGSVNLLELMEATTPGFFVEFGGHKLSGGFTVVEDKVHFLQDELSKAYEKISKNTVDDETNYVDGKLYVDEVNWDLYDSIERISPFGMGNPKPLFLFKEVEVAAVKTFGKEKSHLELMLKRSDGTNLSAIQFFAVRDRKEGDHVPVAGTKIDLVAHVEKVIPTWSSWKNPSIRLRIVDVIPL
jgi:single-stranded-DNA-specific exonuclease